VYSNVWVFKSISVLLLGHITVLRMLLRPIVTDQVAWSVGLSVTLVNPAKSAQWHSAVSCAKTAEPVDLPFWLWTRVGPRKQTFTSSIAFARWRQCVLMGGHIGVTWRIHWTVHLLSNYFNYLLFYCLLSFVVIGWNTTSFSALTLLVGSFDPQKPSPKWPIMCLVGR